MIRGLYTAATGMIVQERKMENVSQNLANVDTVSFKKQEVLARAYNNVTISNRASSPNNRRAPIGQMQLGVIVDDIHTDFEQDRKSTRLNSSHVRISYAVFCLKKKT